MSEPQTTSASPKSSSNNLVVRSPLVPDDDMMPVSAPAAKTAKPARRVAMADAASAPAVEEPVVEAPVVKKPVIAKPVPEKTKPADTAVIGAHGSGDGGPGSGGGTPATDATPPASSGTTGSVPGSSASEVTPVPLSQPVESAPTLSAEPVAAKPPAPSPFAVDFKDMINTTIAGFPLWLMVVVGILLAAALVFGIGGARRPKPRVEPVREEHSYAEPSDEEAVPA
jgi:hypothetical protein